MDIKKFLYGDFLHWDDVSELGSEERFATILDDGVIEKVTYGDKIVDRVILTLQLQHDKTVIRFKCNKRTLRNLVAKYGRDTGDWRGTVVRLDRFVYQGDKETIELLPVNTEAAKKIVKEKIGIDDIMNFLGSNKKDDA